MFGMRAKPPSRTQCDAKATYQVRELIRPARTAIIHVSKESLDCLLVPDSNFASTNNVKGYD